MDGEQEMQTGSTQGEFSSSVLAIAGAVASIVSQSHNHDFSRRMRLIINCNNSVPSSQSVNDFILKRLTKQLNQHYGLNVTEDSPPDDPHDQEPDRQDLTPPTEPDEYVNPEDLMWDDCSNICPRYPCLESTGLPPTPASSSTPPPCEEINKISSQSCTVSTETTMSPDLCSEVDGDMEKETVSSNQFGDCDVLAEDFDFG